MHKISINHVTHYQYDRLINLGPQTIRLKPAAHTRSTIQAYTLHINPQPHFLNWQQDPFGNYLGRVVFPERVKEFRVEVDLIVDLKIFNPFDFFLEDSARNFPFQYSTGLQKDLQPYLEVTENSPELLKWIAPFRAKKDTIIDFLIDLNQSLYQRIDYKIRLEPGVQTCEHTLSMNSGSCRDMTWVLCQGLRHLGLATRFASGYLVQLSQDEKSLDGASGPEKDFTDLHAWTEVYIPGAGWIGLDSTSGLLAGEGHIPLCCTPEPSSAAPISGALDPCESTMIHTMSVQRLDEQPRNTLPYTPQTWAKIDALGQQVDNVLSSSDVRLTMGGEPTFVSLDDKTGEEWHFDALSENKKILGHDLLLRLKKRFAPDGLVQMSQGKWYPGEPLPRWAMSCLWRTDGQPMWHMPVQATVLTDNMDLQCDTEPEKQTAAHMFLRGLSHTLGIPDTYIQTAKQEAKVIEGDSASLKAASETGKKTFTAGYVLPLMYSRTRRRWISNAWPVDKNNTIQLFAGDSPVGLRLPLGDLPVVEKAQDDVVEPRDLFDSKSPLVSTTDLQERLSRIVLSDELFKDDPVGFVHSAICCEVRDGGKLHVFIPPVSRVEHFLELVCAIEKVAMAANVVPVIEGYPPPKDERLQNFSVTPDPGVIEVNVHPAANWQELKNIVFGVYTDAKEARLTTEKFLVDGRCVGTGGGNHIVMGAAQPDDSPFLRRPDLLQSLITYWQHHPALSYLFSSMYIGPTSQAPRIDEARHDSLYELEIAFTQLAQKCGDTQETTVSPPWLVDRLLRNLLVDLTGNTHRAEFCIDKLYSPEGSTGRLGLLEMRGFEMMPHPHMNLVQTLLVRALIAHFWQNPYRGNLKRWGTQLHDQFMLPHFIEQDMHAVVRPIPAFDVDWFKPFLNFRFPVYGQAQVDNVTLELRAALEPWPVMGEESNMSGVSRSVDASVERVQIKATGLKPYHQLTCNGYPVPLHMIDAYTGVAGVRYKAWQLPSTLHPCLDIDAPLVFDVIDTQKLRSLGGCTYHVMHPGGRNYEDLPINENAAQGRRLSRFIKTGHTPGQEFELKSVYPNPEFPLTLDLRRQPNW